MQSVSTQTASNAAPPASSNASAATAPSHPQTADIEAYDVDGNTVLDQDTIEETVYPFLGPGRLHSDVEAARAALEKAYQKRGFQSVVVEIPQQSVRDGIVKLHVVEAPVGRLRVVGSRYYSLDEVKKEVPAFQEGKVPNLADAQTQITALNRLPDRRVTPSLKAGKIPGTVDVDLKVNDTLPVHATVELNNDHSQNTPPLRTTATVRYNNLFQLGHSISATYSVAPQDRNSAEVFAGSYLAPIWDTQWSVLAYGYDSNSNVSTFGGTNVLGKGYAIGLRGILQLPQLGEFSETLNFGMDFKHFLENIALGTQSVNAAVDYWPVVASYSLERTTPQSASSGTVAVTAGIRGLGSDQFIFENKRAFANPNFIHANIDLNHTEELWFGTEFAVRLSGQVADDPLVSSEQFSAGGLTSVRGYLQSEAVADDGVLESVELRSPSISTLLGPYTYNLIDEWRGFIFFDAARLWLLDPLADQQSHFALYSTGVGTRIHLWDHFEGEAVLGFPLKSGAATRQDRPYVQFSVKSDL